jgi:hypothetical protein
MHARAQAGRRNPVAAGQAETNRNSDHRIGRSAHVIAKADKSAVASATRALAARLEES